MFTSIERDLNAYLAAHPADEARLQHLIGQLASDPDIAVRSNMAGHVTSSLLVLDTTRQRVAMIFHNAYQIWIPAGGHLELDSPSPLHSAFREAAEEMGIVGIQLTSDLGTLPIDIDTHPITARPSRNEGAHHHHDFCYLAIAPAGTELVPQLEEVAAARWLDVTEYLAMTEPRAQRIGQRLRMLRSIRSV